MGQSASSRRWREGTIQSSSSAGGVGLACALSVELAPMTLPVSGVHLPMPALEQPHSSPPEQSAALQATAQQLVAPRPTANWPLPAPGSTAVSVPAAQLIDDAATVALNGERVDPAARRLESGDAALRGAQLAATRRELDAARDRILRLLQQVVATQAARDHALEQANQQVRCIRWLHISHGCNALQSRLPLMVHGYTAAQN